MIYPEKSDETFEEELSNNFVKALSYNLAGEREKALVFYQHSFETALKSQNNKLAFVSLLNIAEIHKKNLHFKKAERIIHKSIQIAKQIKRTSNVVPESFLIKGKRALIEILLLQDKIEEIKSTYRDIIDIRKQSNYTTNIAQECKLISRDLVFRGKEDEALELLSIVLEYLITENDEKRANVLSSMADIEVVKGKSVEKAITLYQEALRIFQETKIVRGQYRSFINYARALLMVNNKDEVKSIIDQLNIVPSEKKSQEEALLLSMIEGEMMALESFVDSIIIVLELLEESKNNLWLFTEVIFSLSKFYLLYLDDRKTMIRALKTNFELLNERAPSDLAVIPILINLFHAFLVCYDNQDFDTAIELVTDSLSLCEEKKLKELNIKSKAVELFLLNQRELFAESDHKSDEDLRTLIEMQLKEFLQYSLALISCCQ